MKLVRKLNLSLAIVLAVFLPLEQVRCACMGEQAHPAPVASQEAHGCCKSTSSRGTERHSQQQEAAHACVCPEMVPVLVPAVGAAVPNAPTVAPLAVLTVSEVIAPVSILAETTPALDVGSPPLPDDPGAHGLRAPPASA